MKGVKRVVGTIAPSRSCGGLVGDLITSRTEGSGEVAGGLSQRAWKTATDAALRGVSGGNLSALCEQGVNSVLQFASGVVIARATSRDEFGLYALANTAVLLVLGVERALVASPYTVFAARLQGSQRQAYESSCLAQVLALCAGAGGVVAAGGLALKRGGQPMGGTVLALACAVIGCLLLDYGRRVLFAALAFKKALGIGVCVAAGQLLGLSALSHWHSMRAATALLVVAAASLAGGVMWLIPYVKEAHVRLGPVGQGLRQNWALGRWVVGSEMVAWVTAYSYPWYLASFRGASEAGLFAACQAVVGVSNPIVLGVSNTLRPRTALAFADGGVPRLHPLVRKAVWGLSVLMGGFFLAICVAGERLTLLLYGPRYSGSSGVMALLALSATAAAVGAVYAYGLWAMARTDVNFLIATLSCLPTVLAGPVLVKAWGASGAALGQCIGNCAVLVTSSLAFGRLARACGGKGC